MDPTLNEIQDIINEKRLLQGITQEMIAKKAKIHKKSPKTSSRRYLIAERGVIMY